VHYCSLENKHTSQVYQQNKSQPIPKHAYFSDKDFFIKTAKVFGEDIPPTLQMFKKENYRHYVINENYHFLEFHPQQIRSLVELNPEIGISYSIWDRRGDESLLRELRLDYTTAGKFEYYQDV
jgi:exopolysaccharide biosynthesis predicted pyruvyltransferase EpsI